MAVIEQNRASTAGTGCEVVADGTSGFANGVVGESSSPGGNGVFGVNNATAGGAGVVGLSSAQAGTQSFGTAASSSGYPHAVVGFLDQPAGWCWLVSSSRMRSRTDLAGPFRQQLNQVSA